MTRTALRRAAAILVALLPAFAGCSARDAPEAITTAETLALPAGLPCAALQLHVTPLEASAQRPAQVVALIHNCGAEDIELVDVQACGPGWRFVLAFEGADPANETYRWGPGQQVPSETFPRFGPCSETLAPTRIPPARAVEVGILWNGTVLEQRCADEGNGARSCSLAETRAEGAHVVRATLEVDHANVSYDWVATHGLTMR